MAKRPAPNPEKTGEIGHYSGSERIAPHCFEERDLDLPHSATFWFEEQYPSKDFTHQIEGLLAEWEAALRPNTFHDFEVFMTGQSHIDMCWLWRYEQTRQKGVKTLRKAVYHAKRFPQNFRYAVSEPQLLAWIKEDDPALFRDIQALQKLGQIELVGGSWVEPDCMMPSGEAMVRQRLYGMRFYRDNFNTLPEVEWFLDSFGYNAGLPQILQKTGAKYFWTTKITWNKSTTFPFVHFLWQSPDGSQLLTSNFGQNLEMFEQWEKYKAGRYLPQGVPPPVWDYRQDYSDYGQHVDFSRQISPVGFFYGAGDGGHGPTHWEVAQMQKFIEIGHTRGYNWHWAPVRSFFAALQPYSSELPIWNDELYLEQHRGTFTTHSEVKRHNRRLEALLLSTERLAMLLSLANPKYSFPQQQLEKLWKIVLLNQFHDMLPGSSIPEVYDDVFNYWRQCDEEIADIFGQIAPFLPPVPQYAENFDNSVILFNPLGWSRKSRVFIPLSCLTNPPQLNPGGMPPYARFYYGQGARHKNVICQPVAAEFQDGHANRPAGWWAIVEITGNGLLCGALKFEQVESPPILASEGPQPRLANHFFSLTFDAHTGALIEVVSKKINGGDNLISGLRNLLVEGYRDTGSREYPAWDIRREYWKYPLNYDQQEKFCVRIADQGPVFSTLEFSHQLGGSAVTQTVRAFQDDPTIYCMWAADWKEPDVLLKVGLQTTTGSRVATSDQMYCATQASTLPQAPGDKARYEKVMHQFVDLSTEDHSWGIALLNEGKYAYDASGGQVRMTLHRSPKYPTPSAESWVHRERALRRREKKGKPPKYSGLGPTSCRFALLPHNGGVFQGKSGRSSSFVHRKAEEFNHPIVAIGIGGGGGDSEDCTHRALDWDAEFQLPMNLKLSALKACEWGPEPGIVLRFCEICGERADDMDIALPPLFRHRVVSLSEVDLLERPLTASSMRWDNTTHQIHISFGPFEVKSLLVTLSKAP